jgi:hypothetical protein
VPDVSDLKMSHWIFIVLAFDNLENIRPYPSRWLRNVPCKIKLPVGNFTTVLANVEACQGFACITPVFEGVNNHMLKCLSLPFEDAYADFICAYREDMLNPLVISVAQHIQHNFKINLNTKGMS